MYSRSVGKTPWEALEDDHAAFNFTVMRGSVAWRRMKLGLMYQRLPKDSFGIDHIVNTLKLQ